MKFIEVIDYNKSYPQGIFVKIPIKDIKKFHKVEKYTRYYIDLDDSERLLKRKYKEHLGNHMFIEKSENGQYYSAGIMINHKTQIQCQSSCGGSIYFYFSDLDYEEFEGEARLYDLSLHIADINYRFEILDI
jgi:hypothetical protein